MQAKRTSLFLTPAALALAAVFLGVFLYATQPVTDPREGGRGWLLLALAGLAFALPFAGFQRNRAHLNALRAKQRVRSVVLIMVESVGLLAVLLVFGQMVAGGYGEASLQEKGAELALEGAELRKRIDQEAATRRTLERMGEHVQVRTGARRGETLLGTDGAVLLYDAELRALAAMVPSYRAGNVDWRLEGYPAKLFPVHWRSRERTSLTEGLSGSPTDHSQELLPIATALQQEISAQAKRRGSLRQVAPPRLLEPKGPLDFGYVDPDGWFALYSDRHGVFVLFRPELKDNLVHWRCRVHPREALIPGCTSGVD